MSTLKVISFDVEGTLIMPDFSHMVWDEAIPALYALRHGLDIEAAKATVQREYDEIGEHRMEWYDIKYWFNHFGLGDYREALESHKHRVSYYPEVEDVLSTLKGRYRLIAVSNSAREFLSYMLWQIEWYFTDVFSAVSDCSQLKSPAFYLWICQKMGISPGEMAHIGDHWEFDFLMPKEAGITAFHIDRKGQTGEKGSLKSLRELEDGLKCP